MPTYPIINLKTGETQELVMSVNEYTEWRKQNPEWDKDWSAGCAGVCEVGELQDKVIKKHPGWKEILTRAKKAGGSQSKIDV